MAASIASACGGKGVGLGERRVHRGIRLCVTTTVPLMLSGDVQEQKFHDLVLHPTNRSLPIGSSPLPSAAAVPRREREGCEELLGLTRVFGRRGSADSWPVSAYLLMLALAT